LFALTDVGDERLGFAWRRTRPIPDTKSQRARMTRPDKRVMQFRSDALYVANEVDGNVTLYGSKRE